MVGSESGSDPKTCSENSMAYYRKSKTSSVAEEQKLKILSLCPIGEDCCMAIYVLDTLQDERITELDSDRSRLINYKDTRIKCRLY
jgi:hypothetical protein